MPEMIESVVEKKDLCMIRINAKTKQHVSMDVVNEFEESILEVSNLKIYREFKYKYFKKIFRPFLAKIINAVSPKFLPPVFCVSMGVSGTRRGIPYMFFSSNNIVYMFDAWPEQFETIKKVVKAYNITQLFVSSKTSALNLNRFLTKTKVYWCPEGCNPSNYRHYDYKNKDIDVLQFGRKYDIWHNKVVEKFEQLGISYLYEKKKGQIIFNNRKDFIDGLGRSKISICFPTNITHNKISSGISTMTNRYLQSMASKCLIVGIMPDEMKELFEYNPIILVDLENPVEQIADIIRNYESHIPLIEKNYQECLLNHTWQNRWRQIMETLNN